MPRSPLPEPNPGAALLGVNESHRHLAVLLARLERLLGGRPDDRERRLQLHEVVTDFDRALNSHLDDEERDVFPQILSAAQAPDRHEQAFALVSSLMVEHREMTETWSRLRVALRARSAGLAGPPFAEEARDFITRFRAHLDREDREFPDLLQATGSGSGREGRSGPGVQ